MKNTSIVIPVSENANVTTNPLEDCLKSTSNFTETTYHNICSGQIYSIPAGFWDITLQTVIVLFITAIALAFLRLIFD